MSYRDFDPIALEREYSPSSMLDVDVSEFIDIYIDQSAGARADLSVFENLQYGSGPAQVLDYFPANLAASPLHVFIHGGYWQQLSHRESASMAPDILRNDSSFATLNYTLAPEASISEMVEECRLGLAWLIDNAEKLGFDPTQITISGHSAGAHLAAMLLSGENGDAEFNPKSVILISGVFDLEPIRLTSVNDPLNLSKKTADLLSPMKLAPSAVSNVKIIVAENDTAEFKRHR